MITRSWRNNIPTSQAKSLGYNPLQWAQDFEMELLENNREVFLRVYNTDVEEYWLDTDND